MPASPLRNLVIAQSGGPSMVINQSLVGAVLAARAAGPAVGRILGARHGIDGVLKGDFLDLRRPSVARLEAVAATPSSALGSCRHKPTVEDCDRILAALLARRATSAGTIRPTPPASSPSARWRPAPRSRSSTSPRRSTTTCSATTTPPATAPPRASSRAPCAGTTSTTAPSAA